MSGSILGTGEGCLPSVLHLGADCLPSVLHVGASTASIVRQDGFICVRTATGLLAAWQRAADCYSGFLCHQWGRSAAQCAA